MNIDSYTANQNRLDFQKLKNNIILWAKELGFQDLGVSEGIVSQQDQQRYQQWLNAGYHGELEYMEKNAYLRFNPDQLHPGFLRIISVRMDYLPAETETIKILNEPSKAYISRYALGRDYHKLIRKRLTKLGKQIEQEVGQHGYRAFVDSAPVMERLIAQQAGLGWTGKNSLILNRKAGSFFFLGELFTNLPLPVDEPMIKNHCGKCTSCIDKCPTGAIVAPYTVDARKCISYLTIENKKSIPVELRKKMGNRIFGCDDCQLVCPWNRFANFTKEKDWQPRHGLDYVDLVDLFLWTEEEFKNNTMGSAIRRSGFEGWLRNIAVALGNAPTSLEVISALKSRQFYPSLLVQEHVEWALEQHL